jgi:phospholipid transport system substrate-binding protein|tara:strand:+ start:638 stop:1246 length:609 start_codon:yes stop_codon:yes gene_type:complete
MLVKKIIKTLLISILSLFFTLNSFSIEPNEFVQQTVDDAAKALDQSFGKDLRITKLKTIAKNTVDIKGIGFYSLGKHRKTMSDEKKKEYLEVFTKYFLKTFASRLAQYSNPKIIVNSQKKLNEKYTMVSSILVATENKPEVKIDWRVITKDPNQPLIIDLIIEGVSLAKVQKEEFNSIIQSNDGDINALFKTLNEFVEKEKK